MFNSIYADQISQEGDTILTLEDEQMLAIQLREGIRLRQQFIPGFIGSVESLVASANQIQKGEYARIRLVQSQLKWVIVLAKKVFREGSSSSVSLDDVIQEGNLGLLRGVVKFDETKGLKLSTYCTFWIKQYIYRYIESQQGICRLPPQIADRIPAYKRLESEFLAHKSRVPTVDEIKERLKVSTNTAEALSVYRISSVSLNQKVANTENMVYADIIADTKVDANIELFIDLDNKKLISNLLDSILQPRNRAILIQLYGLDGNPPKTLEEVGELHQITRERVRQLRDKAFIRIRTTLSQSHYEQLSQGGFYDTIR